MSNSPSPSRDNSTRLERPRRSMSLAPAGSREVSPSTFVPPGVSLLSARRPSWTPLPLGPFENTANRSSTPPRQASNGSVADPAAGSGAVDSGDRPRPSASRSTSFSLKHNFLRGADDEDEDGTFWQSLQIDMKELIGDAVGNMSIAPSSRDIVLGARKGLFIIDLQSSSPEVPRFLPQGGTWDVADVQWNPHPSHDNYIVSTSSEKLLIWNLLMGGKTAIQHVLKSHYRAITDINWHNSDPDVVASTGLDSWIWAWDLRTPEKAIFGLSVFNSGGTQVKWNRLDPNVLASSHMSEVLIWDRRKGSVPISRVTAHDAKIYGIDWAHDSRTELITCSLDKTIKVWDVYHLEGDLTSKLMNNFSDPLTINSPLSFLQPHNRVMPKRVIRTAYPVWRARDLPFGRGLLSLPQRGETRLEMFTHERQDDEGETNAPVEVFEGHKDVVKEYVWRRGGKDGGAFQLITWSKDKTLRFWPIDRETMQRVGAAPGSTAARTDGRGCAYMLSDKLRSFRDPPQTEIETSVFSAPVGHRAILAEVRAHPPGHPRPAVNPILLPHHGSGMRGLHEPLDAPGSGSPMLLRFATGSNARGRGRRAGREDAGYASGSMSVGGKNSFTISAASTTPVPNHRGETMTRGNFGGRSARVDPFQWLQSVRRVGERRDDSGSGADSHVVSRVGSRERDPEQNRSGSGNRNRRSGSRVRAEDEDGNVLQDEITSVISMLSAYKVRLEKHDLTRRRTCTIGLHGPWGASSSVFIRVTFTFPREYPHAEHPLGTPTVDLERNNLISVQTRAFIQRRLRNIREQERPCLELCLRFLLGAEPGSRDDRMDSEASSDEDGRRRPKGLVEDINSDSNFAEPRTSQGVFSPNGQLVCFFRAPPRLVKNVSVSLSITSRAREAILSNAIRHLTLAARDRKPSSERQGGPEDEDNVQRIMNSLLTFASSRRFPSSHTTFLPATPARPESQSKTSLQSPRGTASQVQSPVPPNPSSVSRSADKKGKNYAVLSGSRLSTVYVTRVKFLEDVDRSLAENLVVDIPLVGPVAFCEMNAQKALDLGRRDLHRVFTSLGTLVCVPLLHETGDSPKLGSRAPWYLAQQVIQRMYDEYSSRRDVQMLAMISLLVLTAFQGYLKRMKPSTSESLSRVSSTPFITTTSPRSPGLDYFSLRRRKDSRTNLSFPASRFPSSPSTPSRGIALSSSASSRGSWSSLFAAGSVRQFVAGVQDSFMTPAEAPTALSNPALSSPSAIKTARPRQLSHSKGKLGQEQSPALQAEASKSWSEVPGTSPSRITVTFSSAGHASTRRSTFSQVATPKTPIPEKQFMFTVDRDDAGLDLEFLSPQRTAHFVEHIHAYCEILLTLQLFEQRLEMLKSLHQVTEALGLAEESSKPDDASGRDPLGIISLCSRCKRALNVQGDRLCPGCLGEKPHCTVCRLPVNGLSHACMFCFHVTHVKCWKTRTTGQCSNGCGCHCDSVTDPISPPDSPPHHLTPLLTSVFIPMAFT